MTGHENFHEDFFEVHHAQLTALTSNAERLVLSDPAHVSVEQFGGMSEGVITAGMATTDEVRAAFEAHDHSVDEAEAEEIAQQQNRTQAAIAEVSFVGLQARATIGWIAAQAEQGLIGPDFEPISLPYSWAERHTAQLSEDLTIDVTRLHEVEQLGDVTQCHLRADDGPVRNTLSITTIGERITDVQASVTPREDEDFKHWVEVLGPAIGDAQMSLVGNFDDEAALDSTLNGIRQQFAGSPRESEVGPILEGIRARAMAAREAASFRQEFGLTSSLPSVEDLDAWTERLGAE